MGADTATGAAAKVPHVTAIVSADRLSVPCHAPVVSSKGFGHGSGHEAGTVADTVLRSLDAVADAGSPRADAPPVTTRIRRATDMSARSAGTIRREIGKVPAPYKPLEKTPKPQPATSPSEPTPEPAAEAATPAPTPTVANPRTLVELADSAESSHTTWISNHDVLLDILLGPFEANWFKAKACLTMDQWPATCTRPPSHAVGIKLMTALVTMRKAKWTAFITNIVKPQFEERMKMFGAVAPTQQAEFGTGAGGGDQDLQSDLDAQDLRKADKTKGKNLQDIFDSVGAEAVTSDVDLSSGGSNSELGVQFVNSRFRTHFAPGRVIPYDPGTVFDINVYASDWIHGEASFSDSSEGVRTITPGAEVPEMTEPDKAKRTEKMEIWSLVKVRRNMSDKEWAAYTTETLTGLTDPTERAAMEKKLAAADREHAAFRAKVEARQTKTADKLAAQEVAFFGPGGGKSFGAAGEEFEADASFTRAANSIYEELLQEVKELRVRIQKLREEPTKNDEAISALGVLLGDKIAEALTYANEVYATEGAVQHTVLKQGAGKKLDKLREKKENEHLTKVDYNLSPELYLQAVNENVGDSLHSIHHFHSTPKYAVYRAGKYLARLCDATDLLLGARKTALPGFADLFLIGKESVRVKKITVEGVEGDPAFVDADPFFKKYGPGDLATVTAMISRYGASVAKVLSDKKREDAARTAEQEQMQAADTAATS